ncbi:MAG: hypothetical protein COB36_03875 [Alphaproteobacteria bacterium]|nr:MAG: hypothetical protein COB36_03875 [Alphaproteobacteria bacterium]
MGSLSSSPKAPTRAQTVYVPAPVAATATTSISTENNAASSAAQASRSRTQSLLSRSRSRFGTIATSFQGFLGNSNARGRKTLLGE